MIGFDKIVEQKIKDAILKGEFDDLPTNGKPLVFEDLTGVPDELRMGFKVLKNAGVLPEEMQLKKEIANLEELLATYSEKNDFENLEKAKIELVNKISNYRIKMEKLKSSRL